jgi:WD40 repeat protein
MSKRSSENQDIYDDEELPSSSSSSQSKRAKTETALSTTVHSQASNMQLTFLPNKSKIQSSLSSPEIVLSGHEGAVYSIDFDPTGEFLCSASYDKQICKLLL